VNPWNADVLSCCSISLRQAGLEAELRFARYGDQGSRLFDQDGRLVFAEDDSTDGKRPEVDRTALRDILLASAPADTVRWGHGIKQVRPNLAIRDLLRSTPVS